MARKFNEIKITRNTVPNNDPFSPVAYGSNYMATCNVNEDHKIKSEEVPQTDILDELVKQFPDTWRYAIIYTVEKSVQVGVFGAHIAYSLSAPDGVIAVFDGCESDHSVDCTRLNYVDPLAAVKEAGI